MTTAKKARKGPLMALKRFIHSKHMVTLVWILGIVVIWEIFACIVAATKRTPVNVLPHLYEIIGSFFSDKKVTGKMTMIELIGTAGGLTIVSAFNAIPIVALAPVINNWTRDVSNDVSVRSTLAKIIVVTISCTAAMSVNAFRGLTELKPFSEDLMTSYAAPKIVVFTKLRLPNSLPYVFTALRVSVPASVIGALVTEYFAEDTVGVGRQIRENIVKGQYTTAWAYIATACAIGIGMYIILILVERMVPKRRRA